MGRDTVSLIVLGVGLLTLAGAWGLVVWLISPRRYRYEIVMLGDPSGAVVTRVTFVRFRHEKHAQAWCDKMNAHRVGATRYVYQEIRR